MPTSNGSDSVRGEIANRLAESIYNSIQGREYLIPKTSEPYFLPNLFYGIHFWRIWRNGEQADIIWYALFVLLGIVSLIELTSKDRTTGTVDLLRSYSCTGEHPGKVRARHLRGDIDHVMI